MSRILRITDCDTGESKLEVYEVPEGACITLAHRDGDEFFSVIAEPRKARELAAWLAARFAGKVPLTPQESREAQELL